MSDASLEKDSGNLLLEKGSENLDKVMPRSEPFKQWLYNSVLLDETVDELFIKRNCIF